MEKEKLITKEFEKAYPEDGEQFVGNMYDIFKKGIEVGLSIGFVQGYTCAAANLVRLTGDCTGTHECELLQQSVSKLSELKKYYVDKSDLEILNPTIKELERKRNIV